MSSLINLTKVLLSEDEKRIQAKKRLVTMAKAMANIAIINGVPRPKSRTPPLASVDGRPVCCPWF